MKRRWDRTSDEQINNPAARNATYGHHNHEYQEQAVQRGFWIYARKIVGPRDERLCYVGMTGDVTRVAQSPFGRATLTLGNNKNANTLRKALEGRGVYPERCKVLTLAAVMEKRRDH
jgi:hypothetical protein